MTASVLKKNCEIKLSVTFCLVACPEEKTGKKIDELLDTLRPSKHEPTKLKGKIPYKMSYFSPKDNTSSTVFFAKDSFQLT